jgi:peptide/nickel transport system permease protein
VKLALMTIVIVVPLGILGGVVAALRQGKAADRFLTIAGLSLAVTPEFVVGIVLILVFAVNLGWLPAGGSAKGSLWEQFQVLLLPSLTLTAILFGYLSRMARAGTIEALNADYTRTATLKGLKRRTVLRRHVLRNSLLPTIAVIASQMAYLLGGLLVTETLFNYRGLGLLIFEAAGDRDIPMLMGAVFIVGALAMLMTLLADVLIAWLNPRVRLGSTA